MPIFDNHMCMLVFLKSFRSLKLVNNEQCHARNLLNVLKSSDQVKIKPALFACKVAVTTNSHTT